MFRIPRVPLSSVLLALLLVPARPALAAWPSDPQDNVPLCTQPESQIVSGACSDDRGGAIVVWTDFRSGTSRVYAQRVSGSGVVLWTTDGVAVSSGTADQSFPCICADGASGAIIAWQDDRSGTSRDIYVQRINSTGALQWGSAGTALCTASANQSVPSLVSDGQGGAIVAWEDARLDAFGDIYARRVNASGTPQWTTNGIVICNAASSQMGPKLAADGAGGAFVVWTDNRSGSNKVYARRVSSAGSAMWTANGVLVSAYGGLQHSPQVCSDDDGGVIVVMTDTHSGTEDVLAQHLDADGNADWTAGGRTICDAADSQVEPMIAPDGSGGALLTWSDLRNGTDQNIYAQRLGRDGFGTWTVNGVSACSATGYQSDPVVVADGAGGAVVAWRDARAGYDHVYARRISATGTALWTSNGVLIGGNGQCGSVQSVPDGAGGMVGAWWSVRTSTNYDVYAQRVDRFGAIGDAEPTLVSVSDVARDQGGQVVVEWTASYLDAEPTFSIDEYSVWRKVPSAIATAQAFPASDDTWDEGRPALRVLGAGQKATYWEYVGSTPARGRTGYSFVAPTTTDSSASANPTTSFMVSAEVTSSGYHWDSASMSGYSVDNLAPTTPAPFTGTYAGGTSTLTWGASVAPDLAAYRLYRGATPDFTPGPANLVTTTASTACVDAAGLPQWYKVCAVDVHGNASAYAAALPNGTLAVDGTTAPRELVLSAPAPNPLRGTTTLRLALPRAAHVMAAVYDQQGRRVRALASGARVAGEHVLAWDGRDEGGRDVASGVYFVRADVGGRQLRQRLVLLR